jgi:hypothetical protein
MQALRALSSVVVATLSLWSPAGIAGDQAFEVGEDLLVVDIDGNWEELDASDISASAAAYEVEGVMRWFFEPHPRQPGKISNGDLRILVQDLRREVVSQGGEISGDLQEISGGNVIGYYVRSVDPKLGASDYKYQYIGYVVVGQAIPVEFSILWSRGGDSQANRALAAVRNMRLGKN